MKKKRTDHTALVRASPGKTLAKPARIRQAGPNTIEVEAERLDTLLATLCAVTGTSREIVAIRLAQQVGSSLVASRPPDPDTGLKFAISTLAEIAPQNVTEAMLATQSIATHEAALYFMGIATHAGQTVERCELAMRWATRLMRLQLDQIEAMQKLKGKAGQQRVTVEHVHVHEGGQAIVGVAAAGGGGVSK